MKRRKQYKSKKTNVKKRAKHAAKKMSMNEEAKVAAKEARRSKKLSTEIGDIVKNLPRKKKKAVKKELEDEGNSRRAKRRKRVIAYTNGDGTVTIVSRPGDFSSDIKVDGNLAYIVAFQNGLIFESIEKRGNYGILAADDYSTTIDASDLFGQKRAGL
jgi:uncharacterized protein YtpQ (UPF0354 family)